MFYVVRTKDYRRVIDKIVRSYQRKNIEEGTQYRVFVYSPAIETVEGQSFDRESFFRALKDGQEHVYIFRNFCPFNADEIAHMVEKYMLGSSPVDVYVLSATYEIPQEVSSHVVEIDDYLPSQEEAGEDYFQGLSSVEVKKAKRLGKDLKEARKEILKQAGGILEVFEPYEVEQAVGLGEVIELIKAMKGHGKGTLLMGVPGTGKTLIAKNLSKEDVVVRFNFSAVYSKYVGESERNLRIALKTLEQFGDCFVFIDEFEKALSTGQGDSGVSRRLLGEFLSWLEDRKRGQYIIATLNDLTNIPVELVRTGRWDFMLGLTPPPQSVRNQIIDYYAQKYSLPFDAKLASIQGITPADIATIYRVAYVVGLEKAKRYVKLTKDLHPHFDRLVELVKKYTVLVWEEDIHELV